MESDLAALCQSAKLFEVLVPKYKQLKVCRRELCLLKQLWDMIVLVRAAAWASAGPGWQGQAAALCRAGLRGFAAAAERSQLLREPRCCESGAEARGHLAALARGRGVCGRWAPCSSPRPGTPLLVTCSVRVYS